MRFKEKFLSPSDLLGESYMNAVQAAYEYLKETDKSELRRSVGKRLDFLPEFPVLDKRTFVESYRKPIEDDILTGFGIFKITESRVLQVDWTAGHYQLPLGYHYPPLDELLIAARTAGIVDDTHNNTPGHPVKRLAQELIDAANPTAEKRLNRVLNVDTGTVAAGAALKSILYRFMEEHGGKTPVFILQEGNYHGTDFFEQRLRGMWEWMFRGIVVELVRPNDANQLRETFRKYEGENEARVAAFVMEPVLMNNRAIYLRPDYVHEAKRLCIQHGAFMFLDEIQTGFWSPEIFMTNEYGGVADVIAVGKGLTSGFSPMACMICESSLDNQSQYSSISTNGNADMAALAGLAVLDAVEKNADLIREVGDYYHGELHKLLKRHPDKLTEITGHRHLSGINVAGEEMAKRIHRVCLDRGIFTRLQSYKDGASTLITKPPIIADAEDVDFVIDRIDSVLRSV